MTAARTCSRYAVSALHAGRVGAVLGALLRLLQPALHGRMEAAGLHDLGEALHRHAIAVRREVAVDVVLEPHARADALRPADRVEPVDRARDRRSSRRPAQILDRRHEHLDDLGIRRVPLVGLPQHADARAAAGRRAPSARPVVRRVAAPGPSLARPSAGGSRRVVRILADDHLEHGRGIRRRCAPSARRYPPAGSAASPQRGSSAPSSSECRPAPDAMTVRESSCRCRCRGRPPEAGGDGRRRAAARSGGDAIERVRVLRCSRAGSS